MAGDKNAQKTHGTQEAQGVQGTQDAQGAQDNGKKPASRPVKEPAHDRGYIDRIIAAARTLDARDAFEATQSQVGRRISAAQAKRTTAMHARNSRRITAAFAIALVVIAAISLCLPYYGVGSQGQSGGVYTPDVVFASWQLWFKMTVLPLFDATLYNQSTRMLTDFAGVYGIGTYTLVINRTAVTFLVILCGVMLALSGMLFQTSFRNPLAAPTMLGVSDGVTLGGIIYCMLGYINISDKPALYALLVYGVGAATVAFVLFASRALSGGKRYSIMDMLLLGTVVCQLLGGANQFVQNFVMDDATWANFYDVQQASNALTEPLLQAVVVIIFIITFCITFVMRFKLNLVSLDNDEGEMMGVSTGVLRGVALVLGSAMQLAALASIGQVAMLSMAVPFLVRYLMAADFRTQFLGNCLIGSTMLLICMVFQHFIVIGLTTPPIGTIVSVLIVPFFVWAIALSKGRWV